jgi:hypothetical protein
MPKTISVALKDLEFDPANPRLIEEFGGDQQKMFRYLITDIGVEDLLESLAASGLFNADPIIVRAAEADGKYYVVEGNRRLAALKLLTGEAPADKLSNPTVPVYSPAIGETFNNLEVQTDWPEDELQAYLGYKHVTASREWSPDAKAKFVFEHAKGDLSVDNLRRFARTLGTKYPTLKRWLTAYLVLKQAAALEVFDPQAAPSKGYFGTFYTLLGGEQAQTYLGIKDVPLTEQLVPGDHVPHLAEFLDWTIGTRRKSAAVNSRQQKQFEQILSSPRALKHFRLRGDIESSLLYTEYNAEEISAKLQKAAYSVEECLTKLFDVREDERVKSAFDDLEGAYDKAKIYMIAKAPEQK